ncbi:3-hydroxylacyl-ACP dehydratase [Ramlibacter terrae]|uniref:3-hydroxylacyl-ACP dehydratase n=1 Tax=Ramlibacter terrae TaxID=2732511 RepID=A0ABX6PA18_9BURK|nr:3-hydroxylacyl-ACP dehydratase [Ramlibacter terrae]
MLSHAEIARRIPHQGAMCLLERVVAWTPEEIRCEADSHHSAANPLRAHDRLGIACGIEYAAQAMAVHGSLVAEAEAVPRAGYLASVRGVELHARRLDDVAGPLLVKATRLLGDGNHIVYSFEVASQAGPLMSGRATVVLDAALAASIREGGA